MNARMRDILGSIFMLVFVLSLWTQRNFNTPFGGIFPDIWMGILAGLIVVTILLAWTPWCAVKDDEDAVEKSTSSHWFDMAVVGCILFAWVLLLRYVGFIATGAIGFSSISWFLNERKNSVRGVVESVAVGVAMVGILVLAFEYGLKVPLPKGNLFD